MQTEINAILSSNKSKHQVDIEFLRGGTLQSVADMGVDKLKNFPYDACYLFAGVNNITAKSGKKCHLRFNSVKETEEFLLLEIDRAYTKLISVCKSVIICHIIGLDIATYNKKPRESHERDQIIINEAVCRTNIQINKLNMDHNVRGPWLADTIHSTSGSHTSHKYKMLPDGLDTKTTKIWAKKIFLSI